MTWLIYGFIAFTILCGLVAKAFIWAGTDDERNEYSGALEGDQRNFGQSSPS